MKKIIFMAMAASLMLSSCEKDENPVINVYENGEKNEEKNEDATTEKSIKEVQLNMNNDYANWHYFTFENGSVEKIDCKESEPKTYDIAFHRYDVKTNGLRIAKVATTDFEKATQPKSSDFLKDKDGYQLSYDLSLIMNEDENGYISSRCNPAMTNFAERVAGSMPPQYELVDAVYFIELKNGDIIKLQVTDHHYQSASANIIFKYQKL